jgi:hypothetical protein
VSTGWPIDGFLVRDEEKRCGLAPDDCEKVLRPRLCGVRRQSIYLWIKEWKVERLIDALKLSRATGIPIEKFAGAMFEAEKPRKQNDHITALV